MCTANKTLFIKHYNMVTFCFYLSLHKRLFPQISCSINVKSMQSVWLSTCRNTKNRIILHISDSYLMIKCLKMLICHMVMLMIWVCLTQHHNVWQISQFAKSIHNSSPISLASWCRLLCYPREDRCESKALWDPDGTFPTIRFGLPLENDPFPVCDTNVSLSASNEMTPANEKLKNTFSPFLLYPSFS